MKAGYLFMNRSAIDEDAGSEVLKVFELEKSSLQMIYEKEPTGMTDEEDLNFNLSILKQRKQKGIGLLLKKFISQN